MKKKTFLFIILISYFGLFANWIDINRNNDTTLFNLTNSQDSETALNFTLNGYNAEIIDEENSEFLKITHPEAGETLDIGKPYLPIFTTFIAIPDQGTPQLNVVYNQQEHVNGINIYPCQPLQSESKVTRQQFTIDDEFYIGSSSYPEAVVALGEPMIMRDIRIIPLIIKPFIYNPLDKELAIFSNIDVTITTSGRDGLNIKERNRKISSAFEKLYKAVVLNYESNQRTEYQDPSYLIITSSNSQSDSYAATLAEWKKEKGFEVTTTSLEIIGETINEIKNYIFNAYHNWDNPPEYVCLIGDAGGSFNIPTGHMDGGYYGGEGDHFFTELDGNDMLSDIFIGRLSINSISDLQTIISKIFNYEKEPYLGNTEWYNKAFVVGDPSSSGPSTIDTKIYVKNMMNQYSPNIEVNEVFNGSWVSQISNNINEGRLFFNYRGFGGMSGWSTYDINSLNNGFMLPVATALTCNTGDFEGTNDCISEAFLKAGTPTNPKGAIECVG